MKIDSLEERREKLCLKFAKACVRNEKLSDKEKHYSLEKRGKEIFQVKRANTEVLSSCEHAEVITQFLSFI